ALVQAGVEALGDPAGLAELLDHPVALVPLGHQLDVGPDVLLAGGDEEARAVRTDGLVLLGGELESCDAQRLRAFAYPFAERQHQAESFVQVLHALVDLAEERLVPGCPRRALLLRTRHGRPTSVR